MWWNAFCWLVTLPFERAPSPFSSNWIWPPIAAMVIKQTCKIRFIFGPLVGSTDEPSMEFHKLPLFTLFHYAGGGSSVSAVLELVRGCFPITARRMPPVEVSV